MVWPIVFFDLSLLLTIELSSIFSTFFANISSHMLKPPKTRFYHLFYNESYPNLLSNHISNSILFCGSTHPCNLLIFEILSFLLSFFTLYCSTFNLLIFEILSFLLSFFTLYCSTFNCISHYRSYNCVVNFPLSMCGIDHTQSIPFFICLVPMVDISSISPSLCMMNPEYYCMLSIFYLCKNLCLSCKICIPYTSFYASISS